MGRRFDPDMAYQFKETMEKACNNCRNSKQEILNDYLSSTSLRCYREKIDKDNSGKSLRSCYTERMDSFPMDILSGTCGKRARFYQERLKNETKM